LKESSFLVEMEAGGVRADSALNNDDSCLARLQTCHRSGTAASSWSSASLVSPLLVALSAAECYA
jgi:hypothetical protein